MYTLELDLNPAAPRNDLFPQHLLPDLIADVLLTLLHTDSRFNTIKLPLRDLDGKS